MSVENHRHCQATVLGATGTPVGHGTTWPTISTLENDLTDLESGWVDRYFYNNGDVTDDLAGILRLLNVIAKKVNTLQRQYNNRVKETPLPGDLISVDSDERTVNVKNNIPSGYSGLVGVTSGTNREFVKQQLDVTPVDPNGPVITNINVGGTSYPVRGFNFGVSNSNRNGRVIATITYGGQTFEIRELEAPEDTPDNPPQPTVFGVVFLGFGDVLIDYQQVEEGNSATAPQVSVPDGYRFVGWDTYDWQNVTGNLTVRAVFEAQNRYLVTETENGIIYDIGVSGYEDDTMLNYRETI